MLKKAGQILEWGVHELKAFPGAQAAAYDNGRIHTFVCGNLTNTPDSPKVSDQTLYDLASLTKPTATASAIGILLQQGRIGLEDTIQSRFPTAGLTPFGDITVEMLLSHTSGLTDWLPLFKSVPITLAGNPLAKQPMLAALLSSQPVATPASREIYSDLDFFLLGLMVEKITGKPLDDFVKKEVLQPLELNDTCYRPKGVVPDDRIAPTELCPWREKLLQGEVHDENTWACGQVTGQAGLFSNALDLMTFALEWIDGFDGDGMIFEPDLLELFTSRPFPQIPGTFTLGWDTVSKVGSLTGKHFSTGTIGHHGFTGTSFWIDLENKVAMALLTNRVNFGRENKKINQVRPEFFDAAWKDISR